MISKNYGDLKNEIVMEIFDERFYLVVFNRKNKKIYKNMENLI